MLMKYMASQRSKAMRKLSKLQAMEDIYHKEHDLHKIRQKKEKSK